MNIYHIVCVLAAVTLISSPSTAPVRAQAFDLSPENPARETLSREKSSLGAADLRERSDALKEQIDRLSQERHARNAGTQAQAAQGGVVPAALLELELKKLDVDIQMVENELERGRIISIFVIVFASVLVVLFDPLGIFIDYREPFDQRIDCVHPNGCRKTGLSRRYVLLGIVRWGDGSVDAALANSGITEICTITTRRNGFGLILLTVDTLITGS